MKKTLLLSVVASTLIFAGGDIAPVEPAVVTPAPAPVATGWKFSGQGVLYYQTLDVDDMSFFDQASSSANAGLQLTATNDNLIGGIGFGAQINGLGTLGLEEDVVTYPMQMASELNSAYISQLYLTYGIDNTSIKIGRQELPKALSPFAFSEDWNVFKNTFNAALVVNTDIQDTVLVGAWVRDANHNHYMYYYGGAPDMNDFSKLNGNDGIWMLTAQNKSISDLTLTGSFYYANDYANILWADAQYNAGLANIALQGGAVMLDAAGATDTKAFGVQVSGKLFDMVNASIAYSHVNNGDAGIFQVGGVTTVLYTDTFADQENYYDAYDNDKFVVRADADMLGGNLAGVYAYTSLGNSWIPSHVNEFDLTYSTNITKDLNLAASYYYIHDNWSPDAHTYNGIRAVARYNF